MTVDSQAATRVGARSVASVVDAPCAAAGSSAAPATAAARIEMRMAGDAARRCGGVLVGM